MKTEIEVINTTFEKVMPKENKWNIWSFLSVVSSLLFILFYILFLTPLGWLSIIIMTLTYKFILN
jgi:hypothetical protein